MLKWLLLASFLTRIKTLNILLFVPTLSYSHIAFNARLGEVLTEKGHNVTMLLIRIDDSLTFNSSVFDVIPVDVGTEPGRLRKILWSNPGPYEDSSPLNPKIVSKLFSVSDIFVDACRDLSKNRLLTSLRQENFDVGILEQYDSCGLTNRNGKMFEVGKTIGGNNPRRLKRLGVFELIGIKTKIWLSATALFRNQAVAGGVDLPYSYVPELFAPFSDLMSFGQKSLNLLIGTVTSSILRKLSMERQNGIFKSLGFRELDFHEEYANMNGVLINSLTSIDFPTPQITKFTEIAGISIDKSSVPGLNEYWQDIADRSKGFILVSFGGIARTIDMGTEMQKKLWRSFAKFPNITFIVKYESDSGDLPTNVVTSPWIPQKDLMAHEKYRAIFTHGGWSSILETVSYERPMILMPLFADHAKNSKVAEAKRVAVLIDKKNLTQQDLVNAIHTVLTDKKFALNCKKLHNYLTDRPIDNQSIIDWRIRMAARESTGRFSKHLRLKSTNLNFLQYYCLDIFLPPVLLTFTSFLFLMEKMR